MASRLILEEGRHPKRARLGLEKSFVAEGGRGSEQQGNWAPDSALTRTAGPRPAGTYSHRMMLLTWGLWGARCEPLGMALHLWRWGLWSRETAHREGTWALAIAPTSSQIRLLSTHP